MGGLQISVRLAAFVNLSKVKMSLARREMLPLTKKDRARVDNNIRIPGRRRKKKE